jgi:hypothetical protein
LRIRRHDPHRDNLKMDFITHTLSARDLNLCHKITGCVPLPCPDKQMGFLIGWFLAPLIALHIIFPDIEDVPIHDHSTDNLSVMLSGGYTEIKEDGSRIDLREGDRLFRRATDKHTAQLPPGVPYAITLFIGDTLASILQAAGLAEIMEMAERLGSRRSLFSGGDAALLTEGGKC